MTETVLIVEDEPDFASLLELWIGRAGYTCSVASTGPDALRRLYDLHPDLVVLDVALPGIDGWGILDRIRGLRRGPVLAVSAAGRGAGQGEGPEARGAAR